MADPWTILGLRKGADDEQLWRGYAKVLRQVPNEEQRRRARDAFEALTMGLWGRFADSVNPDQSEPVRAADEAGVYDGPLSRELAELDKLLSGHRPIDEMAIRDQFGALFDDPSLQQAEVYLQVEPALAALLEKHLPQSEPFVLLALDRFHHVTDQAREHPSLAHLLDRADELALLESVEAGHSELAKGWRPLAKPASTFQRWRWARDDRRGHVSTLYAYAGWHNPRFRRRLDVGEWAWWSKELSRERTSFGMLIVWLLAAVLMGVAAHHRQAQPALALGTGVATFAFLWADSLAARWLIARHVPRPFDGSWTLAFATAALMLPLLTRLLPPEPPAAALVAGLALAIGWGLRHSTGMSGEARSSAWLDSTGLVVLAILFFALSLSIPWERYAMLASCAWLLHAVLPQIRRAVAMALDRKASLPWGYLLAVAGALLALAALFAAELDINRESTRMALLLTGYALFSLSIYPGRPFPLFAALLGCVLIGGYLVVYCEGGGEYHPGPGPSAGETLISAERGDVLDWKPFPAHGEEMLERIKRNNPGAYARLMPVIRNAACERGRDRNGGLDRGRDCAGYLVNGALYGEVSRLFQAMSNRHHVEWTRLEARVREAQFRNKSGACSSAAPQFDQLNPIDIRRDHAALVLDIVASGPRPPAERPNLALPDLATFERAMEDARNTVAAIEGGPVQPALRNHCINQLVRAHTLLRFDADVTARINRGGYPQDDQP